MISSARWFDLDRPANRRRARARNVHIITGSSTDREYPSTGLDSFELGEEVVSRRVQLAAIVFADYGVPRFGTGSAIVWQWLSRTRRQLLHGLYNTAALLVDVGAR